MDGRDKIVVQRLIDGRGRENYQQATGYLTRVRMLYDQVLLNIEASAALAQWIELMRADDSHFRKMVKAAQTLPMLPPLLDESTNNKLYRTIGFINSAQSRQGFFETLREQYGDQWLKQKQADIMPNPARWLANGLINAYWRNNSTTSPVFIAVTLAVSG